MKYLFTFMTLSDPITQILTIRDQIELLVWTLESLTFVYHCGVNECVNHSHLWNKN